MAGRKARTTLTVPTKLTRQIRPKSSRGCSSARPSRDIAAACTNRSTGPTAVGNRSTALSSLTSHMWVCTPPTRRPSAARPSGSMSTAATVHLLAASLTTVASPMPLAAPVTKAVPLIRFPPRQKRPPTKQCPCQHNSGGDPAWAAAREPAGPAHNGRVRAQRGTLRLAMLGSDKVPEHIEASSGSGVPGLVSWGTAGGQGIE
jgi:hypothetical protein